MQRVTELLYCDKSKAFDGYTLFEASGNTYLIDMEGNLVNKWHDIGRNPRLLDNGNLLDGPRRKTDISGFEFLAELDWNGDVIWEYHESRPDYHPHHDFVRIFNKKLNAPTTIYIANRDITNEQLIAAGYDPKRALCTDAQIDALVEVDMSGNVVWEWWFFDHIVQDVDPSKANYVGVGRAVADYPGRLNLNLPGKPMRKDWLHCNSVDYNEELDQVVINTVAGEFYAIDHGGTFVPGNPAASINLAASSAGDFLYRFGDPARYQQGDPPRILEDWTASTPGHKQIGGSHNVHWIKRGLPGAGHFLLFNNGQYLFERTPQSYVFEINPFLDASKQDTGRYVNPPEAGYYEWVPEHAQQTHKLPKRMSNQIVSIYCSKSNTALFSHIASSAQRLPNGNTLICTSTEGRIFEVTPAGELAWEYVNPVTKDGAVKILPDCYPMTNSMFRAYRYGPDHPALADKDLAPKGALTSFA